MPLTLYRRHSTDCRVHDLGLSASEKRFFTDCECPIWITGTTDTEQYPRQSLNLRDWKAAEAKLRSLRAESKDEAVHGPRLSECVQSYLDSRREEIGVKVLGQYKLVLNRLRDYAAGRNAFFIRELSVDLVENFKTYGLAGIKSTSKATLLSKLRHFLREAFRRGWLLEPLVEKIKPHKAAYEEKYPYSEEEVVLILDTAETLNGGTTGYATNGRTFRLLLELMLETGMRVSDAVRFDPARCERSQYLWIYSFVPKKRKKNEQPKPIEVFLTDRVKKAIDECDYLAPSLPFAYRAVAKDGETDYLAQAVYERMKAVGQRCGVEDCRPHRLRDTFAVRALLRGIALEDVSKLLGHSSVSVTEKYYSPWVPSRKLRLERLLAESLVDPQGNRLGNSESDVRTLAPS